MGTSLRPLVKNKGGHDWDLLPIQAQNWTQQIACIRSGRCMVVFKILLIIFTAPVLAPSSLLARLDSRIHQLFGAIALPRRDQNSFLDGPRSDANRNEKSNSGDHRQLLKLRVSQHISENFDKVQGPSTIAYEMANSNHSACFKI